MIYDPNLFFKDIVIDLESSKVKVFDASEREKDKFHEAHVYSILVPLDVGA